MTPQPTVGEIVAITTTDSHPLWLVCSVDENQVTGVLLADLSTETIHQLRTSEPDTATRRQVAIAIESADEPMLFTVPITDYARVERDSSRPGPFVGGE
ncbi:hypothetical protein Harman_41650 [Haloarcula mannanilytica]|uniref:Uncharacterized protein n=1 Tax=Haloarcula mannanilytica TaxID=2509225 RepID=A0A4C2ERS7_9EURY|nr:hypothetical protein [Haloarcula mannanilytica]GCF16230.1 hypothetical protein Harman_41650 [Haloarcula mannanilytica]